MLQHISTPQEAKQFIVLLAQEIDNFHPLIPFSNYQYQEAQKPRFTAQEAAERDKLLSQCFDVCANDDEDFFYLSQSLFMGTKSKLPATGATVILPDYI